MFVYIPVEYVTDSGPLYAAGVENGIDGVEWKLMADIQIDEL